MNRLIDMCVGSRIFRYLFAGGLTTAVNFALYAALTRLFFLEPHPSNIIAVSASVLFAYVINKLFVFRSRTGSSQELFLEFVSFISARGLTIALDIGGLFFLHSVMGLNDLLAKIALNIVVIILNYAISRFFIFKQK